MPGEPRARTLEQKGIDWRQTGWRAAHDRRFTFVVDRGVLGDKYEMLLADNQADPYQLTPLRLQAAADHPDAARLHAALAAHLREIGDPFRLSSGQG